MHNKSDGIPRRTHIGLAGIDILSDHGPRGLTHRAIDDRAGLPRGSTSYYARTRDQLISLIVDQMAQLTKEKMDEQRQAGLPTTPEELTRRIESLINALVADERLARARFSLMMSETTWDSLAADSSVRKEALHAAEITLTQCGINQSRKRSLELLAFIDGLMFELCVAKRKVDIHSMVSTFIQGMR